MPLYCSSEIFEALRGMAFPATKEDLLDYAEMNDASEAVVVSLDQLADGAIYRDITEVCENARIECSNQIIDVLADASFPATREDLLRHAQRRGASDSVMYALSALPSGYTFDAAEEMCKFVL